MAEHPEAGRIAVSFEPTEQFGTGAALFRCSSIDMVNSQKFNLTLATTRAFRATIAVVQQSRHAQALLPSPVFGAFESRVIFDELPACQYLAAFACPLKSVVIKRRVIAMKVMGIKGQFIATYGACPRRRRWPEFRTHWCNLSACRVTPIIAELKQGVKWGKGNAG